MLWIISKQNLLRQVYKRMEQRCAQLGRLSEDWRREMRERVQSKNHLQIFERVDEEGEIMKN